MLNSSLCDPWSVVGAHTARWCSEADTIISEITSQCSLINNIACQTLQYSEGWDEPVDILSII